MKVYHYLPEKFAIEDIQNRRLKISRFGKLNDSAELYAVRVLEGLAAAFAKDAREYFMTHGLICFGSSSRNPALWARYADAQRGICLGFDVRSDIVFPVRYVSRSAPPLLGEGVNEALNSEQGKANWAETNWKTLALTKYDDWSDEQESRIFTTARPEDQENGLEFLHFSDSVRLCEVLLGPCCALTAAGLREILDSAAFVSVEIRCVKVESHGRR